MENGFKCPHCGMEYDGLDFVDCEDMEGEFQMTCENEKCRKDFLVKFETIVNFVTEKNS